MTLLCPVDVSAPGQVPAVLQKVEEHCGDSRAEPSIAVGLILRVEITDTCCFPRCFGWQWVGVDSCVFLVLGA